jgi:hypothetical protein
MFSAQHLVNVDSHSIIPDCDKVLQELAYSYVTQGSLTTSEDDFTIHHPNPPSQL